jgi:hypothetical protein
MTDRDALEMPERDRLAKYIEERLGWYGVLEECVPGITDDIMCEVNNTWNRIRVLMVPPQ